MIETNAAGTTPPDLSLSTIRPVLAPVDRSTPEAIITGLRTISALDGLSDCEFRWLAEHGTERRSTGDGLIFHEGEPACFLTFILAGEIQVRRRHSGPIALFIGRAGQMTGKLPFSRMKTYGGEGYSVGPIWVLDIHQDLFPDMLAAIPSMGQRCVSILLDRVREVTRMEQQAEKLAALGKLAANLSHELNNPASAAQRSADRLIHDLRTYREESFRLGSLSVNVAETPRIREWFEHARERMDAFSRTAHCEMSPLDISDRELQVNTWLSEHGVQDSFSIAPALAESPIGFDQLEELAGIAPPELLPLILSAFGNALRIERMAETVMGSASRIFDIISAIRDYSYMDQAPVQDVDLSQSLLNTLAMFQSRLSNVVVETYFDPDLPCISAYGSELSQVWTALIENALDAMRDYGTLRIRASRNGEFASVEITDDGPGIPAEIQSRIFEPFFTTKAPGSGLGLGLDTANRIVSKHSGFLAVQSKPGETCFQVRLPLERAGAY